MFYLVGRKNTLVRESSSRMALRRIRRKSKNPDSLRITEGKNFADSLVKKEVKKVEAKVEAKTKKVRKAKKTKK